MRIRRHFSTYRYVWNMFQTCSVYLLKMSSLSIQHKSFLLHSLFKYLNQTIIPLIKRWGKSVQNIWSNKQIKRKSSLSEYLQIIFFHLMVWFCFPLTILMVYISLELTRANPDWNIFSVNVELTSTFFTLQRFGPSPSPNFKQIEILNIAW